MSATETIRLTIKTGQSADTTLEARKVCDFLFERCSGNIAEEGVLMYLSRARHDHEKFPWTTRIVSPALLRAIEATAKEPA
jgi:hypothetical protein